jgi:hypothetical protein
VKKDEKREYRRKKGSLWLFFGGGKAFPEFSGCGK